MNSSISIISSFLAGLLSFLSPCVFPMIPVYLALLGKNLTEGDGSQGKARYFASTALFVMGFSLIFIVLSIIFSGVSFMLSGARTYINIVSGIIVLLFGLQLLFNFLPFMNYEKRAIEMKKPLNLAGSFVFGLAFGAGWTPCIGPVLSGILFMAAGEGNVARAVLYLALYSLGLALPFFLFALLGARLSGLHTRLKKILPVFNIISGLLIIAVGVLILLGQLTMLNSFFQRFGWSFVL